MDHAVALALGILSLLEKLGTQTAPGIVRTG